MSTIAVAIVNHQTAGHLRACIASLLDAGATTVVLKDNGSTDGSVTMVEREFPLVRVHSDRANLGYGLAANLAIADCVEPYVLLLNADTIVPRDALEVLARHLDEHPDVAVVGPRLHGTDGQLQRSAHGFPRPFTLRPLIRWVPGLRERSLLTWSHDRERAVDWVKGAALAIRRTAFDAVGGFDPGFFMYFEETDLCARLREAGWRVGFTPACIVVHTGGASTEQYRDDMAVEFYTGMRRFYERHYTAEQLRRLRFVSRVAFGLEACADRLRRALPQDEALLVKAERRADVRRRVLRLLGGTPIGLPPSPGNGKRRRRHEQQRAQRTR